MPRVAGLEAQTRASSHPRQVCMRDAMRRIASMPIQLVRPLQLAGEIVCTMGLRVWGIVAYPAAARFNSLFPNNLSGVSDLLN